MAFYANLGYQFELPNRSGTEMQPDGSIVLSSALFMPQLQRRKDLGRKYPHLQKRLFDPQLYLAGLDVNQSPKHCARLATYPWFGIRLEEYKSSQQKQYQWQQALVKHIPNLWQRKPPTDENLMYQAIRDCIDFQEHLGFRAAILPSPLTSSSSTNYDDELFWLDLGLNYIRRSNLNIPVFATVALSDNCVNYVDPLSNRLLDLILDAITAREVDGVYIVLEQGQEPGETRHCSSTRALHSLLHLVHVLTDDGNLRVGVNFIGQFGLVCEAAGAEFWTSGWYKSVYRLRLADKLGIDSGRAYPSYWSYRALTDIHLDKDFDNLNRAGLIAQIADRTDASIGLLQAAFGRRGPEHVPDWQYRRSNVKACREHYFRSSIEAEGRHSDCSGRERLDLVQEWLQQATDYAKQIRQILNHPDRKTRTEHVQSWLDAFCHYRKDHSV